MPVSRTILAARIEVPRVDAQAVNAPPAVLPKDAEGIALGGSIKREALPKVSVVAFGSSSMINSQGKPRWRGPGDTMRFEMTVRYSGDAKTMPLAPALYTNANHNEDSNVWRAHKMTFVRQSGDRATFAIDLPIYKLGNYRATGVLLDGDRPALWASKHGIKDVAFRPYAVEHDRMLWNLINVMNLGTPGEVGSFEDMLGDGTPTTNKRYTLKAMKEAGVQCIRLLPIQPRKDGPYSKTALFEIWSEYSKPARELKAELETAKAAKASPTKDARIADLEARIYRAALASLQRFIEEAHALGITTVLDIVPNHVGRDVSIQDAFFLDELGHVVDLFDPATTATRLEVRRNDGSQLAINQQQADTIQKRIDSNATTLQDAAPHIFGKWLDTHGAKHKNEIADGGWYEWKKPGTWQLNHGTFRNGYSWFDKSQSEETKRTRAFILREMAFWTMLGIDGFRIDHGTGLPWIFYQHDLNLLQAVADRYRPGLKIYIETEDFHTHDKTKPNSDTVEQGGFRSLLGAVGPDQMRAAFDASWRQNSSADAGNHDEGSAMRHFGGDWRAYARFLALEALLGGPNGRKMGDEYGEMGGLDFRGKGSKLWTLSNSNSVTKGVYEIVSRAGRAKQHLPALHHRNRHWLTTIDGKWHERILAAARFDDTTRSASGPEGASGARSEQKASEGGSEDSLRAYPEGASGARSEPKASEGGSEDSLRAYPEGPGALAVVASNLHGGRRARATMKLTSEAAARLEDDTRYMAYDHMSSDRERWLWPKPTLGKDLKKNGIYLDLEPYQVQALDIMPIRYDGIRWHRVGRRSIPTQLPIPPSVRVIV